ncbi:DUF6438 domain-containing protein [bacterium]|nr:DUF6438 domain-containing protein [bacterium]
MRNFLLILILGLSVFACKSVKIDKVEKQTEVLEDFVLYLERTVCFGTCPVYTMTVNSRGKVTFHGIRNVDFMGNFEKNLSKKQVKRLAFLIDSGDFWKYDEVYDDENITDLPSFMTQCTHRGKTLKVLARANVPVELRSLQNKLEATVGLDGFSPIQD